MGDVEDTLIGWAAAHADSEQRVRQVHLRHRRPPPDRQVS